MSKLNVQLIQAAKNGNLSAVRTSLGDGANINAKDNTGATALCMAAHEGHMEIVKLLLEKGADVGLMALSGFWSTLGVARQMGHTEITQLLEKAGAKE